MAEQKRGRGRPRTPAERGSFGARLVAERIRADMSTANLSIRSGVPLSSLYQIERGDYWPQFEVAARLAAGLGVSLAAFDGLVEPTEIFSGIPEKSP